MDSKDAIKDKILKNAIQLMNEFGYGALNLSELARYSKMTKQRIYYHFKTPEDILIELASQWVSSGQQTTLEALAKSPESGAHKVVGMSQGLFNWIKKDYAMARLGLVLFQSAPHIKSLNKIMTLVRSAGRDRIKSFLLTETVFQIMKASQLENVVSTLHSIMHGSYFYVVSLNEKESIELYEKNCELSIRQIIDSYLE